MENQRGTFLIGWGGDLATVEWNGFSKNTKNFKFVTKLEERFPKVRLNDGKASPSGVIFAGIPLAHMYKNLDKYANTCLKYS